MELQFYLYKGGSHTCFYRPLTEDQNCLDKQAYLPITALSVAVPSTWLATRTAGGQQFPRSARNGAALSTSVAFLCSSQGFVREQVETICSGQATDGNKGCRGRKWDSKE